MITGSPTLVIDGEDHAAPAGTFARLDPSHRRTVRNERPGSGVRADHVRAYHQRLPPDGVGVSPNTLPGGR